jgi:hypothetical protein
MSNVYAGSCNCGAVKFEITGEFERFFLCHCQRCRKGTGSAHAANLFSTAGTLNWISGQDKVTLFRYPHTRHTKAFCQVCGSGLPYARADGNGVVVPAGSLDSDLVMQADAHIFLAHKASWDQNLAAVPGFDEYPVLS